MTSEAPIKALVLAELPELTLDSPKYTEAQNQLARAEGAIKTEKGWWELPSGKLLVPEELAPTLVSQTHQVTHLGHDKLEELIRKYFLVPASLPYAGQNLRTALPAHRSMLPLGTDRNLRGFS